MTEPEARQLRDHVFERPTTDLNWDACKAAWLTPDNIFWLQERKEIIKAGK